MLALEAAADHIHGWHPTLMPGIRQTADYAYAAIRASAPALPPHDVEKPEPASPPPERSVAGLRLPVVAGQAGSAGGRPAVDAR
ncbi:Scr1 family TA system antitoxin-like transcriptional regulator [Streptomyces parvus]|uniref:Scr1 family TA system antitoxin-like transcriptional regulator n=1 Tax=Streptomyces parvus TaxID=66428 RepID=UPI0033240C35